MTEPVKRYFEVTKIYAVDEMQARKLVAVARGLCLDRQVVHVDEVEGEAPRIVDEDFLDDEPRVTSALLEVPAPELLVGAELIEMRGRELDEVEIAELLGEGDGEEDGGPAA